MSKRIDLTGQRFGRLVVVGLEGLKSGHLLWKCRCNCGKHVFVFGYNLMAGNTKSCGCYKIEKLLKNSVSHGMSNTATYKSWASMKRRCSATNLRCYKWYGGRGITVCDRWLNSFDNFLKDMGERPVGTSLDRIDTNGNYEPSNCKWSTIIEQQNNRRTNRFFYYNGSMKTISEISRSVGIKRGTLYYRMVVKGWTVEESINKKVSRSK